MINFPKIPTITKNLIIINFIVYLGTMALHGLNIDLDNIFGLHYFKAESFHIYQLVTYMFLHMTPGISHIFFNMFALFMFGGMIEQAWGRKRYLFFYFFTGIGAAIIQEVVWFISLHQYANDPMIGYIANQLLTIGASGAIFGILLAFGVLFPNIPLFIFFIPIPIKAKYVVFGYGVIELFEGIASSANDNVAHFAHLGGMLFGLILILYWRKKYGRERFY